MKRASAFTLLLALIVAALAAGFWLKSGSTRVLLARRGAPDAVTVEVPTPPGTGLATQASETGPAAKRPKAGELAVTHEPLQPRSGQRVRISVDSRGTSPQGELLLEYQMVEPGRYIARKDKGFEKQWLSVPLNDAGLQGDTTAGDGIFSAELEGDLQKHRRLVRYRVRSGATRKVIAPDEEDKQGNYAYFVYDGVPPWKGAIHPKAGAAQFRQPVTFSSEALQRVPVYHFISSKASVEQATWRQPADFGNPDRQEYRHTGTLVYDGMVYDHVGFRARGGAWRHAMGKNMWKFNFLAGHRFEARDHYGNRYKAKWDKLNLGACIQQGDYGMRGEQGMFEALGFRLFNLAGVEASRTHWVHLRIIDDAEESPANQYEGDFWGLYLAVENLDDHFLKEHDLPPGNLYKMEFGAKTAYNGDPAVTDQSDVNEFVRSIMRRRQNAPWWEENVDLPRYYSYRAILEAIHHYDIDAGKNYFYYHHPETKKWIVLPWDIDLSWGDHMYGGGYEPFYRAGILFQEPFKRQYQERLAELRDLLFNPDQINLLIDEHAAMISDPKGAPSLADADRAKWDYHPVLASPYVMSMKAGQGKFYFGNPRNTFQTMVKYMKNYAAKRAGWIDTRLLKGYTPPPPPQVAPPEPADASSDSLPLRLSSSPEASAKAIRWRLAEVTDPASPVFDSRQHWTYEIQPLWEHQTTSPEARVPASLLVPGHSYRVRARWQMDNGEWSRWSSPVLITARSAGPAEVNARAE